MRHLKHRHQLGRKKEHRKALIANLAAALLRHARIQTTLAKAKALRPFVEKIITLAVEAQKASPERALYLRRLAVARVRDRDAVHTLFHERVQEFLDRPGGYTRIYKLGNRLGDAAEMAVIQLIPASDEGHAPRSRKASRKSVAPVAEDSSESPAAESESNPESPGDEVASETTDEPVAGVEDESATEAPEKSDK